MDQFGCGVVGPCLSIVLPLLVIDVWFFSLAFGLGFFATVVHASQVVGSAILSTVKSFVQDVSDQTQKFEASSRLPDSGPPRHHSDLVYLESGPTYNGMLQPSQGGTERI